MLLILLIIIVLGHGTYYDEPVFYYIHVKSVVFCVE